MKSFLYVSFLEIHIKEWLELVESVFTFWRDQCEACISHLENTFMIMSVNCARIVSDLQRKSVLIVLRGMLTYPEMIRTSPITV